MPKVFCIGDINLDLFLYTDERPAKGIEKKVDSLSFSIGGNAGNSCMALAGLGIDTGIVSCVGSDIFGEFIEQLVREGGAQKLFFSSDSSNGLSVIFVGADGERAIMSSKGALAELEGRKVAERILPKIKNGDVAYFGGYYHLPKMRKGFAGLLSGMRKKGAVICFDTTYDEYGKWELKEFLDRIDLLFINETELEMIAKKKSTAEGIKWLFSKGADEVVLKEGRKGASFFSRTEKTSCGAIPGKAVNATAAGDFFNAGYVYGMLDGYGTKGRLLCGNFVAGQKVLHRDYYITKEAELEKYLEKQNLINLIEKKDYESMSKEIFIRVRKQLWEKPESVFAMAAGKTHKRAYEMIANECRKGRISFSNAAFVELDEYLGLKNGEALLQKELRRNLLDRTDFRKGNILLFNPEANADKEAGKFEGFIKRREIDFMLLGIGGNGHIAFNEPGTAFTSKTRTVKLAASTINAYKGKFRGEAPKKAITLGLKTIMGAKKIILAASGQEKARAVASAFKCRPGPKIPASILQRHRNCTFIIDRQAGKLLQ